MLTLFSSPAIQKQIPIKIAGAGIAGMSAAIHLKKAGQDVVVYEKQSMVGGSRHGDYEGLENWIFKQSMLEFFAEHGFDYEKLSSIPIHQFTIHTKEKAPFVVQSQQPFFHMIKRGPGKDCLDYQLFEQCKKAGVDFKLGKPAPEIIDIDSTGSKKAAAYIKGVNFETTLNNQVHLLLGKNFAPKGYSYLIILNGKATLATAFKKVKNEITDPLKNSMGYFRKKGFLIPDEHIFGYRGSFSILNMKLFQRPFRIGEAGGFQDFLFGFGIRMAMNSGLTAALHLKGEVQTSKRILRDLNRKRNLSFINRILYERFSDQQMAKIAASFENVEEPLHLLSQAYKWNFKNKLRWIRLKGRYEVRPA